MQTRQCHQQITVFLNFLAGGRSYIHSKNSTEPSTLPLGTPVNITVESDVTEFT